MAEAPKKKSSLGCVVILVFLALAAGGSVFSGGDGGGNSGGGSSSTPVVPVGSDGRLVIGEGPVDLGVDDDAFDALSNARVANDPTGRRAVLASGRAFTVPEGTRVRVIGNGFVKKQVRILEGPHAGESGWIPFEWVKP